MRSTEYQWGKRKEEGMKRGGSVVSFKRKRRKLEDKEVKTSSAGLRSGSRRNTWLACVKFMPTAPARTESKKMVVGGSFWKSRSAFALSFCVMSP